jgi:hypothetical protein
MKSTQNEMNNSSCSTNADETVRNRTSNSTFDSTRNQGDLREVRNQGDMRDVTENGGNRDRINMTRS